MQKLPKLTTSRASPKKRKPPKCRRPNKGEQSASLYVSENEADTNLPFIWTTIEAGTQVGSSYLYRCHRKANAAQQNASRFY